MEQMLERLLANQYKVEAENKASRKEMKASQKEMKAEMMSKMDVNKQELIATMDSHLGEMKACRGVTCLSGGEGGTSSRRDRGHGGAPGSPRGSDG
jgi:hypothetical protein